MCEECIRANQKGAGGLNGVCQFQFGRRAQPCRAFGDFGIKLYNEPCSKRVSILLSQNLVLITERTG